MRRVDYTEAEVYAQAKECLEFPCCEIVNGA